MGEEITNSMNQDFNLHFDPELCQECENVKEEESIFDCCICLELSKEPVVTNCGHLYCWSCLYQWLKVSSNAKECPVCKGEISIETLTPIYGHGGRNNKRVSDTNNIPSRPQARRTESLRNSSSLRNSLDGERDGAIRRVRYLQGMPERQYDRVRYLLQDRGIRGVDSLERESTTRGRPDRLFLDWVMTSSGVRAEQNQPTVDNIDLFSNIVNEQEVESRAERRLSNITRVANVFSERRNNSPPPMLTVSRFERRRHENGLSFFDVDSDAESPPLRR